jgi:hypothetical protein
MHGNDRGVYRKANLEIVVAGFLRKVRSLRQCREVGLNDALVDDCSPMLVDNIEPVNLPQGMLLVGRAWTRVIRLEGFDERYCRPRRRPSFGGLTRWHQVNSERATARAQSELLV